MLIYWCGGTRRMCRLPKTRPCEICGVLSRDPVICQENSRRTLGAVRLVLWFSTVFLNCRSKQNSKYIIHSSSKDSQCAIQLLQTAPLTTHEWYISISNFCMPFAVFSLPFDIIHGITHYIHFIPLLKHWSYLLRYPPNTRSVQKWHLIVPTFDALIVPDQSPPFPPAHLRYSNYSHSPQYSLFHSHATADVIVHVHVHHHPFPFDHTSLHWIHCTDSTDTCNDCLGPTIVCSMQCEIGVRNM